MLTLPIMLVTAPCYLLWHAWQERRRRCPLCGQRGTLHTVQPTRMTQNEAGNICRRRVNPDLTLLGCRVCGLRLRRADAEGLDRRLPNLPS